MKRVDDKVEEICSAIYLRGVKVRINKQTAENLVAMTQHPSASDRPVTLPMRVRILGGDPSVGVKRTPRWG